MDASIEGRKVAIEAIATLVNIKHVMVDLILKPAGVPQDVYSSLLYQRDARTGWTLSKRQLAPLIIEGVEKRPECSGVVRAIIEITANWSSFHLANDEFAARAAVQKAREVLDTLEIMDAREARQRELGRQEELARMEREKAEMFRKQSSLLLMMFDELVGYGDAQRRGYHLQDLLNRVFTLYEIPVYKSFTRNQGGEQIDGAFKLECWHYLVECRWREKLADIRQLDGLKGQIDRSGKQTMGVFLSINGWSENVRPLLKQNPEKSILLMDGYDLRGVLNGQADLRDFLLAKIAKLNLESEPFFGLTQYQNQNDV